MEVHSQESGSSLIYNFKINKRYNRLTGNTEYLLKTKIEAALDLAVPVLSNRQEYLVTLRLPAQTSHPRALQFSVDYRGANGDFVGSRSETLECASMAGGALATFNDDDIGSLEVALASLNAVTAPSSLAQCVFASNGGAPVPSDFVISMVDAVDDVAQKNGSNVCGAPVTGSTPPYSRDAYYVLAASVGNVTCDLCECEVTSNGVINSSDALRVLLAAVGATAPLHCPSSPACADQPTITSAGNAVGAIVDVSSIDPLPYESHSEDQLKTMSAQISVGDDIFYNTSDWMRTPYGWYLADKYMWY